MDPDLISLKSMIRLRIHVLPKCPDIDGYMVPAFEIDMDTDLKLTWTLLQNNSSEGPIMM